MRYHVITLYGREARVVGRYLPLSNLPGCHVEVARNVHAAIEYCKKDGDFNERGVAPMTFSGAAKRNC